MRFEQIIKRYIAKNRLLNNDGVYIVALSGGPDSVALLRVLLSLGYNVHAAHCNFHLRGAESDRDENFCKALCQKLNVKLHVVHFDTASYAGLHKVSIEMAARDLRYHWFSHLSHDINADGVCIAHHQDDQVETVLLNIIRGTGLRGLLGMRPKVELPSFNSYALPNREGRGGSISFLRPLLCVSESQVMEYLANLNQDYVIDSTNLQDDAQRNKLRLDIIPMLEKVNPAVKTNIIRMTENLSDIATIVQDSLQKAIKRASIPDLPVSAQSVFAQSVSTQFLSAQSVPYASALPKPLSFSIPSVLSYPAPFTLFWSILSPHGFNRTQAKEITACESTNKEWKSRDSVAIISHDELYIVNRKYWEQPLPELRIPEAGLYRYGSSHIRISKSAIGNSFQISKTSTAIAIDSAKVTFPLTLRPFYPGDRFNPFGMHGSKLVSDYLKDRHRDVITRHYQTVLTDAAGNIVWLVGETIDNNYRIVKGKTTDILSITIETNDITS